jgi:hypothetical protein
VKFPAITRVRGLFCCALAFVISSHASVIVQLQIVEGDGATYQPGSRATRGITVLVTDEAGQPLNMASVSFRLPDQGATGTFSSGLRTEVVTTGPDGRASVWGMKWNDTPGPVQIHITAIKDQARAGIVSTLYLSKSAAPTAGGQGEFKASHGSHKWLWLALAAAAAGGGGAFAMMRSQGSANAANPAVAGINVGTPSITIGHP